MRYRLPPRLGSGLPRGPLILWLIALGPWLFYFTLLVSLLVPGMHSLAPEYIAIGLAAAFIGAVVGWIVSRVYLIRRWLPGANWGDHFVLLCIFAVLEFFAALFVLWVFIALAQLLD